MGENTTKLTPPLKWHGGKHYLAKRIIELMPPHVHYVEPYFGGGAVLLAKDPDGVSEVVNDIDGELTNFWGVLREPQWRQLYERLQFTEMSEWVWGEAQMNVPRDSLMRAWSFFVRCRQSRQGLQKNFATVSRNRTRRGMNEQVSAWLTAIEGLPEVHTRLKRVLLFNRDALEVIRQQDGPKTLFYLDPTYLPETRTVKKAYKHEMTPFNHACLLAQLADPKKKPSLSPPWTPAQWETLTALYFTPFAGKFLLSGYRSAMYDAMAEAQGWHRVDFDLPNNASGGKNKRRMTECVWMNFEPNSK